MSTKLKLLVVGMKWPPETFLQSLFCGLAEAEIEITIACSQKPDGVWLSNPNMRWIQSPGWNGSILHRMFFLTEMFCAALKKGPGDIKWIARYARQAKKMVDRLYLFFRFLPFAGRRWDVVYFPWNSAAIDFMPLFDLGAAMISCRGAQINVAPHDPNRKEMIALLRTTFEKASAVHCVSESIKNEARQYGLDPAKAKVIHPAVDPDFFCPATQPRKNSAFRIVTVSSLIWRKGFEYALLAVQRLIDHGVAAEFHVIGDGPERARLVYTIGELELHNRVYLHGRLSPEAVRSQLRYADVFLLASLSEGISNAVLEAMACGLPVVTTDCGGMREAVADGVEGFVVPVRDPEAMTNAITRLASDPKLCQMMGQAARRRVLNQFTLDQQIGDFISLFQSVIRKDTHDFS
jgi:colanic acid/amylovoran biosynthesis glycosyltransferase